MPTAQKLKFPKGTTLYRKVFLCTSRINLIKVNKGKMIKSKLNLKALDSFNAQIVVLEKQRKKYLCKINSNSTLTLPLK